jgi:hypothetical protein
VLRSLWKSPLRFSARKSLRALNSFHQFFVVP